MSAEALVMLALNDIQCESCPTVIKKGDQLQIAGPSDIRLVCMDCFGGPKP